jgi:hypothetical protein
MLGGGIESLPTAIGKVHWILASYQNGSFKIGEAVALDGRARQRSAGGDRRRHAGEARRPSRCGWRSPASTARRRPLWNAEVTHDQFMTPTFVSMVLGNAVETTTSERRDMTWRATSKLKIGKYGTLTVEDFGAGNASTGGSPGADDFVRGRLVRAVGALLNNPWEPVKIEGIETTMRVTFEREVSALRSA